MVEQDTALLITTIILLSILLLSVCMLYLVIYVDKRNRRRVGIRNNTHGIGNYYQQHN